MSSIGIRNVLPASGAKARAVGLVAPRGQSWVQGVLRPRENLARALSVQACIDKKTEQSFMLSGWSRASAPYLAGQKAFSKLPVVPGTGRGDVRTYASGSGSGKRITQNDYTEKAWEAIVAAPEIARSYNQQIVETEHLFKALLEQPNGLARRILTKAGMNPTRILDKTEEFVRKQPRVSGNYEQVLGRSLEGLITEAERLKGKWSDQYVSVEELVMAMMQDTRFGADLFKSEGVAADKLEEVIMEIRGGRNVQDQDPEGKYEALTKYGRDLTQAARDGKLDPVIGRDDEVRRCIQILSRRTKIILC